MEVFEPKLKRRIDGKPPFSNCVIGSIESHFKGNTITFHFGPSAKTYINLYAWKVLVTNEPVSKSNENDICDAVIKYYGCEKIKNDYSFLKKYGIEYQFLVFHDDYNWEEENNSICLITVNLDSKENMLESLIYNQKELQKRMLINFGKHLTNKPLKYSTTEFEGYLSDVCTANCLRNDITLFPGDADLVVYDDNLECKYLVEFKKHTIRGYGEIEGQSFKKYYRKDSKKYEGIANLSRILNLDYFYNVIYSTRSDELYKIKIEKVSCNCELMSDKVLVFSKSNLDELIEKEII